LVLNIWYPEKNVLELQAEKFVLILEGFPPYLKLKNWMMTITVVVVAVAAVEFVVVEMSYL
jgi:hypothetical protein